VGERIQRRGQHETVRNQFVRTAEQIELSTSPEALPRRWPTATSTRRKIDAALGNYSVGNLTALRELPCCGWPTRSTFAARYRSEQKITDAGDQGAVVVAITAGGEGDLTAAGAPPPAPGELLALHILPATLSGRAGEGASTGWPRHGRDSTPCRDDVPTALLDLPGVNATQLVSDVPAVAVPRGCSRRHRATVVQDPGRSTCTWSPSEAKRASSEVRPQPLTRNGATGLALRS